MDGHLVCVVWTFSSLREPENIQITQHLGLVRIDNSRRGAEQLALLKLEEKKLYGKIQVKYHDYGFLLMFQLQIKTHTHTTREKLKLDPG